MAVLFRGSIEGITGRGVRNNAVSGGTIGRVGSLGREGRVRYQLAGTKAWRDAMASDEAVILPCRIALVLLERGKGHKCGNL